MLTNRDDQLAIENGIIELYHRERRDDLREVAPKRLTRLGLQPDVTTVAEGNASKAIPLGLELPAIVIGKRRCNPSLHRLEHFMELRCGIPIGHFRGSCPQFMSE